MMLIDEDAMPRRLPDELRAEVGRRSLRRRQRQRQWGAAVTGAAVIVVVALVASLIWSRSASTARSKRSDGAT